MIFVFRPTASASARQLSEAVDGIRIRREENLRRRAKPSDKVVMWGAYLPEINAKLLNNVPLTNKLEDAIKLKTAGIRTIEASRTQPIVVPAEAPVDPLLALWEDGQEAAEAFVNLLPTRNVVAQTGLTELVNKIQRVRTAMQIAAPVAPIVRQEEWLARKFNHVGGTDLLRPDGTADFWSRKEPFVAEYRVHSFFGRSIRAGKKIPRTPQSETPFHGTPHAWIRSFESGWMISYADDAGIKQKHRDAAHAAVRALGLNFGAVDLGELANGDLVVLEVNRAPGSEGGTLTAYSRAIHKWADGDWAPETPQGTDAS